MQARWLVAGLLLQNGIANAMFVDGNQLHTWILSHEKPTASRTLTDAENETSLYSYVQGASDAFTDERLCFTTSTTLGQITEITALYVKAHPEKWEQPADVLVYFALRSKFACRKK